MAWKDLTRQIESALTQCADQASFFQFLLNESLEWPVSEAQKIEDISFGWSPTELRAAGIEPHLVDGPIWQIQPLEQRQPWGIFVLEFKHADALSPHRGMAGVLRRVLRGLVASRRKDPGRPSWKCEHLLFICTHRWRDFRFAYFRSKPEESRTPKLKTFGWGPDTPNRTVCEFNLPKLAWPDSPVKAEQWLKQWSEAFDQEPLTNDFFKRFQNALERIKHDLQKNQSLKSADAYTQAQLLLERLIFLYFLQNRGWLNQDRHYLRENFRQYEAQTDASSYYKDFLDKLFWTLSTPPGSSGSRFAGIPFLNGGLFDDDEFAQSSDARKTNPPLKVRNATFKYVFDELLEAFNFTVTEDTPLNQEVAVDPEMLGKVFESIVLRTEEADPEAFAPDKRKATGSYYTPRIVVHFICQEVLYQYLADHLEGDGWGPRLRALLTIDISDGIDEEEKELIRKTITPEQGTHILDLVKPLRCCDPAVGSGAFPVGLLHELVNLRRVLETAANGYVDPASARGTGYSWLHETKEDIVQNCLFGVDIQQQAIEICRLRLWLSLIVDYDLGLDPFEADKAQFNHVIEGISQLPNLEMNFHRGDSLHDHLSGVAVVILPEKASHYADGFQKIARLGEELHHAKRAIKKRRLRVDILRVRLDLSRRIISEELKALDTDESALDKLFQDETEPSSAKRNRIANEKHRLEEALDKVDKDREELERLTDRQYDAQFYVKLRKLEGADFDSPFNFSWYIDFPQIFARQTLGTRSGFDIVVGNPPFVTARSPERRALWRERWPRSTSGKYHMLCPFFELSFGLLRKSGQLGFIVSNAFATRDFGEQLVEGFFPTVRLQKIVDCSGLLFPGHGTPTILVFGTNMAPEPKSITRLTAIQPGGGDLRTAPEESPLWRSIDLHHDDPGYSDTSITVGDRPYREMLHHPWNLDVAAVVLQSLLTDRKIPLSAFLPGQMGVSLVTLANEIYANEPHVIRRAGIPISGLVPYVPGENVRNWSWDWRELAIFPYESDHSVRKYPRRSPEMRWFEAFRQKLENRIYFGQTQIERGLAWYEYGIVVWQNCDNPNKLIFPDLATHAHFVRVQEFAAFNQHTPVLAIRAGSRENDLHLIAAVVNSSTALFLLKQVSYNRGAGEDEHRDRFEFMGGKVQELPLPVPVTTSLSGQHAKIGQELSQLAQACGDAGKRMPELNIRALFWLREEAYEPWNRGLPLRQRSFGEPFHDSESLRTSLQAIGLMRDRIRGEMIAFQEEIDWLIYAAYGLLSEDHPAARIDSDPKPLAREQRPFVLWAKTGANYDEALKLIPESWKDCRKSLWATRLKVIRDNEHIRRLEQPVYKRRWDEQWKVGNQWRCGPIAYAAEFVEAFEWWLREKAEWWLEHKKNGGPVELDAWAEALWRDTRVHAAWCVATEQYAFIEAEKAREKAEENGEPLPPLAKPATDAVAFCREFKHIIDDETLPAGLPFAIPYEDLARKMKIKKVHEKVTKIRGTLNVPRERFHRHKDGTYTWAGLQFR